MTVPFALIQRESSADPRKAASKARNARHTVQTRAEIVKRCWEAIGTHASGMLHARGVRTQLIVAKESNEVRTQCLFSEHCAIRIIVGDQPMRLTFRQRRQE